VPNNFFSLTGSRNGVLSNNTEILVHEAGHNLGLVHTFTGSAGIGGQGQCDETTSTCSGSIDACDCCGDYVCDTPINSSSIIDLDSGCSHPTEPPTIARNFMTLVNINAACRNQFTEGQAKRMRVYLEQAPVLQAMQILPVKYPSSTPGAISGNIIVESGELVIDQDLSMLPGTSITVKKGASLVVKATITGACGQMWQGIIVESDKTDLNQLPTLQGSVTINSGGRIEHARVGVDISDPIVLGSGGGIINTSTAFFINNTIGVRFAPYERAGFVNGAIVQLPNKSSISTTVFTTNADYRGDPMVSPVHIEMKQIFGLPIRVSLFRDQRASCTSSSIGISSMSGGFNANYSQFENLKFGILTDKLTVGSGSFRTEFCKFQGCVTGISADMLESSFVVRDNTFRLQSISTPCDAINTRLLGIAVNGITKDMTCTNNIFQNTNPISNTVTRTTGTHCTGIGTFFNQIKGNQFIEVNVGNKTSGKNGDDIDGLVYFCNAHTNDAVFTGTNYRFDGQVRKTQGDQIDNNIFPTGNIFSTIGTIGTNRVENNGDDINYYFYELDGDQDPLEPIFSTGTNALGLEDINAACLPTTEPCNPPCNEVALTDAKNAFLSQKSLLQQKQIQLNASQDPLVRPVLEQAITLHQQKMNQESGKVLRYYAQDSTQLLVDSLLRWYYLIETMESWTTLAKHHFFTRNTVAFDAIWGAIPVHFNLGDAALASYNRINSFFSLMRQPVLTANSYDKLPATTIAALNALITDCDEASFLAKAILRRNGVMAAVNCQVGRMEPRSEDTQLKGNLSTLILVPNPAQDQVTLLADPSTHAKELLVMDALGRIHIAYPISPNEVYIQLNTSTLPTGLYQVLLVGQVGVQSGRLMIQRN
jgi:hypothetical protein